MAVVSDLAVGASAPTPAPAHPPARSAVLPVWPVTVMFALMPLWFLLGAFYLAWPLFGILLGALLLSRGRVDRPAGTTLGLVFLALASISAIRLDRATSLLVFGLRLGYLGTAFIVGLYVYTLARQRTPWRTLAAPLCVFWLAMVVLGFSGVVAPAFGTASPVELLLPHALAGERFIVDITHLDTTEYNPYGRNPIYRPAAPYPYTNNWGTAYAFLVPFVVAYLMAVRRGVLRVLLIVSLPLSLVPAFLTLNRGMFIALGAGLAYLLCRELLRGRFRLLLPIAGLVVSAWLVTLVIPVGELITRRTSTTDSTADRLDLYRQTWQAVLRSPLLGYGQPTTVDTTHSSEPLGTQGMLWQVMFSHGIPATLCLYLLLAVLARRLAAAVSPAGRWLSTLPVIAAVMTPFYAYIDPNMSVLCYGIGVGLAAVDGPVNRDRGRPAA